MCSAFQVICSFSKISFYHVGKMLILINYDQIWEIKTERRSNWANIKLVKNLMPIVLPTVPQSITGVIFSSSIYAAHSCFRILWNIMQSQLHNSGEAFSSTWQWRHIVGNDLESFATPERRGSQQEKGRFNKLNLSWIEKSWRKLDSTVIFVTQMILVSHYLWLWESHDV